MHKCATQTTVLNHVLELELEELLEELEFELGGPRELLEELGELGDADTTGTALTFLSRLAAFSAATFSAVALSVAAFSAAAFSAATCLSLGHYLTLPVRLACNLQPLAASAKQRPAFAASADAGSCCSCVQYAFCVSGAACAFACCAAACCCPPRSGGLR